MDIKFTNQKTGKTYQMRKKELNGRMNPNRVAEESSKKPLATSKMKSIADKMT